MKNKIYILNSILFSIFLIAGGILFFSVPFKKDSEVEKRSLSAFPKFSYSELFLGDYMDSVDFYIADHFAYRDELVSYSFLLNKLKGIKDEHVTVYQNDVVVNTPVDKKKLDAYLKDTIPDTIAFTSEKGEKNSGLLIIDGKAFQVFGGNTVTAKSYAEVINGYRRELPESVRIYSVVVPSATITITSGHYQKYAEREKENIQEIYKNLNEKVIKVPAWDEIAAHRLEYIYFGTDHHWTGLGAYYAYVAFCKAAELTPVNLDEMKMKSKPNFYGTLYSQTQDESLKARPDTVFYHIPPTIYSCQKYVKTNPTEPVKGYLFAEAASGANSYGVYLGGDWPLMRINTNIPNGKKVLVVKNSYGNPFSTYLISHFQQVFIVDYRYFKLGLKKLITEEGITDVIFINGVFSANTDYHIKQIRLIKDPL